MPVFLVLLVGWAVLTPAQRTERARLAANTRWAKETNRLLSTAPGLRAAFQKLLDEVDPEGKLPENKRYKLAKNAQAAQLARARLAASKKRRQLREQQDRSAP